MAHTATSSSEPVDPNDRALVDHWKIREAPLLPLLHAFHARDGEITDGALRAISSGLKTPLTDLYGTVTFYHFFVRPNDEGRTRHTPRVCDGPVCRQRGSKQLIRALGGRSMPCAGRCDDPIPVLQGDELLVGLPGTKMQVRPSPPPAPNPGGHEECAFRHIREPNRATLFGYRKTDGYRALEAAVHERSPAWVLQEIADSKLAGRGGAGFPTGVKWQAVAEAEGEPKTIVCNADEGEPGCFKDRALMDHDPHALVEGMLLAAYATGATRGFVYLRYEYPHTAKTLEDALGEARQAGYLGRDILRKQGFSFDIEIRRGAGAYICGEETSLLESLEGKHPFPRNKPPYPVTHGYRNLPTVINNVETLCCVPAIVRQGAAWYRGLAASPEHAGTKLVSLSGDVQRPGNYEVPIGTPLRTVLYDWAGGPPVGRSIQAVTMAGLSGGFLAAEQVNSATLDELSIRSFGSFLGAGGIMVLDDSRDMLQAAREAIDFFRHESCGKCFPCRVGTQRLSERLAEPATATDVNTWISEVRDIGAAMKSASACGLGIAAPLVTDSLIDQFRASVEQRFAPDTHDTTSHDHG